MVSKQATCNKMNQKAAMSPVLSIPRALLAAFSLICDPVKEMLPFTCGQKTAQHNEGGNNMSNPNLESTVHELLELKRMREELEAEITTLEDAIKAAMDDEELLTAGAYKVTWTTFTSNRLDTTALKKALPEVAARFTKTNTSRCFSIN